MKGTVIKRGKKWAVVIDLGRDASGKRSREWHSGYRTEREAEDERIRILSEMQRGVHVSPSDLTVGEWLNTWVEGRTRIAETTRDGYEREIRRLEPLASIRLTKLTTADVSRFYRSLTKAGKSPKTVKNCHGVLHKALADAVTQKVLARNPADDVELPRTERPEIETWTADELRQFLAHAADDRLYAAWLLICTTGMRRSEILGLRWRNVDLEAGKVAIVDTVVPVRNKPVLRLGETKSRRSRRVVAVDQATAAVLREHRARQAAERLRAGTAWTDHGLAFTDELGGVISPDWFTRAMKRLAVGAGVTPLTPHPAARHTWATLALTSGVHPKVVQERLGHSTITTTLDLYSHISEGMDREAAETVAALVMGER